MIDEINGLSISQLTQSKMQEVLDEVALNKLIENQTFERKKLVYCHSLSLPQSRAWLSAAPIPALGLHLLPNEFRAAVKYNVCAPIYSVPIVRQKSLDTLGDHAVACHGGRYDFATQPPKGQNFFRSPVCEQENLIPDTNF